MILEYLFWLLIALVLYSYFGYSLLLALGSILFKTFGQKEKPSAPYTPDVTILVAAYNESDIIPTKVENTSELVYPKGKIHQLWVTDGSNDGSEQILKQYEGIQVIHSPLRQGKAAALNRAMQQVTTPVCVLCDANTMLNPAAIDELVAQFANPKVGCVAGEKRITLSDYESAVSSGEGIYWQYESLIKRLESSNGSALSAAGELYAIRTELYEPLPEDTILDDFTLSTRIALKGFSLKYAPKAYAVEKASVSIAEEKKRKVRIAAGAFQFLHRHPELINVFKYPGFAFQFISHKVIRWVIAPVAMLIVPLLNIFILLASPSVRLYQATMLLMLLFLFWVGVGWAGKNLRIRAKALFIPYYIFTMNLSMLVGLYRFFRGKQQVEWEKAKRSV